MSNDLEKGRDMVRDMPWVFENPEEQLEEAEKHLAKSGGGNLITIIGVILIVLGFGYALMS